MRRSSAVGTGRTLVKGAVDSSSVVALVRKVAGMVVRKLDGHKAETHNSVAVATSHCYAAEVGYNFPGERDRTVGHAHLELHKAPAAAHHKPGL